MTRLRLVMRQTAMVEDTWDRPGGVPARLHPGQLRYLPTHLLCHVATSPRVSCCQASLAVSIMDSMSSWEPQSPES
eukprot:1160631-Rhodomonas_salina.1